VCVVLCVVVLLCVLCCCVVVVLLLCCCVLCCCVLLCVVVCCCVLLCVVVCVVRYHSKSEWHLWPHFRFVMICPPIKSSVESTFFSNDRLV
jgi:hypothetical protein